MREMTRTLVAAIALVAVAAMGLIFGCLDPFMRGTRSGGPTVPDVVSYEGDVYPLLLSYCSSCHSAGGGAGGTGFVLSSSPATDYEMIASLADGATTDDTLLVQKATGELAHGGGGVLSSSFVELKTLTTWIYQGALQD